MGAKTFWKDCAVSAWHKIFVLTDTFHSKYFQFVLRLQLSWLCSSSFHCGRTIWFSLTSTFKLSQFHICKNVLSWRLMMVVNKRRGGRCVRFNNAT
jgi:hypothetical protein